ncbi:ATP-dependent DNA helicase PIF1-like [Macrosteles quadrilineatus]|uniref:ATP-dependent DNA helicase PIF1-like n=1 Tax=Macrosteles quadrilineatus TaxID=74068 RepID=UPI0023E09230|nr:ATP-dependent DNA helicase PIF1-like [Macrosteles quadrilineatus]
MRSRRAILSTLIVNVKEINDHILNSLDGHLYELRSADTVDRENDDGLDVDVQLLNTATGKGVPDHVLRLKIGSVCLIMRNLNIAEGLVNGTKVIAIGISNRLITVRLPGQTQPIGIPRITFTFTFVESSPLRVRRRQFPLMLAYCMTGHKSQVAELSSSEAKTGVIPVVLALIPNKMKETYIVTFPIKSAKSNIITPEYEDIRQLQEDMKSARTMFL